MRKHMSRQQGVLSLAVMISGLHLLLSFSCAKGQEKPLSSEDHPTLPSPVSPLKDCPLLPEQAPEGTITVYVAKMQEKSGFVCARAVNGIRPSINFDGFHLQKRDGEQFHDFAEPMPPTPPGVIIGQEAVHIMLPIGYWFDRQFPSFSPAPPGTYRACFRYTLHASTEEREACSEEFSLP